MHLLPNHCAFAAIVLLVYCGGVGDVPQLASNFIVCRVLSNKENPLVAHIFQIPLFYDLLEVKPIKFIPGAHRSQLEKHCQISTKIVSYLFREPKCLHRTNTS
ncbi:hypothetical protein LMH87_004302 [Akanthomyces muscarius]|uniref:Secreted protein n=1 Tax=Akanthomyces muscarius TaxID=2231603 RepID=A0A9W8UFH4_AKAMU|nr:hypothetical protein LMH87_004302 [Akanthomyces muscarius]KAJ4145452.1 hypothetical protein LMH87_004302 [Akanthomyces muscarius]